MSAKQKRPACAPRTAVAYARYSSAGQRDVSIEQQLQDIRSFAHREGYTIVHEYADHARSGYKNSSARTDFQQMISDASSGSFDTVLAWKVDRFGRNREDSAIYKGQLRRLGVSVVYVMEPIPDGAAGVLTEGMLEAIAEWYSRNLSENVSRGMRDNANKCLYNGTRILGYSRGPDDHYVVVPSEAATVRHIFSRYLAGWSAASICGELNASGLRSSRGCPFSPQTLLRIISNERYTGVYIWGDVRVPDGMPAIISRTDWEAAQRMKKKTAHHVEQHAVDFLLTGKAFCGHCGRAMIGDSGTSKSGTTYYYYGCQGRKSRTGCNKKNVRKEALEDFVVSFVLDHCLTDPEMEKIADAIIRDMQEREKNSPLASMEKELADVTQQIENINRAIAAGVWSSSTASMLKSLEENQADLQKSVSILRFSQSQLVDRSRVLFFLRRFARYNRNNPDHRRELINYFINSVYVYDDHLKIVINAVEGSATVPLSALPPDPPCSDSFISGVLVGTHPNTAAVCYVARM